jgi:hypothetical protein
MADHINTMFCRIMLQESRKMAKEAGVTVPKHLTTWSDGRDYMEVWAGSDMVWWGGASNSYEAKSAYITQLIDDHERKEENMK